MDGTGGIVGKGNTLDAAFEDAARQLAEARSAKGGSMEELAAEFERSPREARIHVVAQPHNQWVKAYHVTLTE